MKRLPEPQPDLARARERLARAVALDHAYGVQMNAGGLHLVRHAAFAAFLVLREHGRTDEARRLIAS